MHVILSVDYSPWSSYGGGAQRCTHNIGMAMVKRGHKVTVIYSKPPWEHIEVPPDLPYRIKWASLPAFKSKRAAFLRPLTTLSVNSILKKIIEPGEKTIVHSNGEEGGLVHQLRDQYSFGFICTPHHPHYPEVFFKHDKLPITVKIFTALKEGKYLMQGSAAFHADFCTPPSQWAANMVGKAFNIPKERLEPVPNGVPTEFLNYYRTSNAEKGPIVFFGRLSMTKGVDLLIEALDHIAPSILPEIWIIGRGDLKPRLQKLVKTKNISEKVTFIPWMTHEELGETLSNSRMVVLPSREENFSLAILSSMCVGTPTISTKVGGTPEIIKDQENGLLVESGNPEELAAAIKDLLQNHQKRKQIGKAGAEFVRNNLTWDDTCSKFEVLYRQALTTKNSM